jgi:hypothetical protein
MLSCGMQVALLDAGNLDHLLPSCCRAFRSSSEAFPWDEAPHYLVRDRDRIYGSVVTRRLRAMGIRDKPMHRPHPGRMALWNG